MSHWHDRHGIGRCESSDDSERGSSLLGILSVVATLGILAVIVLTLNFGSSPTSVGTTSPGSPTTTGPQSIASEQQVAERAACQADFTVIINATSEYRALNGSNPPGGTAWATSTSAGGPFIQSWPSGAPAFSLTWNGSVVSVAPAKGRASHGSVGTVSPPTGCFG